MSETAAATIPGPPVTFRYPPRSAKLECSVCGARGYSGGRWQELHRRGHLPCRRGCGTPLTVLRDGTARAHPRRWCSRAGSSA